MSVRNLLDLTEEAIVLVLSPLDTDDLFSVAFVSRTFRRLAKDKSLRLV